MVGWARRERVAPARTCYLLAFAAPKADLSSDQAPFQDTVPTMVGWQPLEPAGEPVPVIRKQLCRDSVVPWKRRSNASAR